MSAPDCYLVPYALQELDKVLQLYQDAQHKAPFAAKALVSSVPSVENPCLKLLTHEHAYATQGPLQILVSKARATYVEHRVGHSVKRDHMDEICRLGQRVGLIMNPGVAGLTLSDTDLDPFEHAHPSLVRCREQASTESPCGPSVLARVRTSVGSVFDSDSSTPRYTSGQFGSDIHDANWMSWL